MLGPWWGAGRDDDAVTVLDGIDEQNTGATTFAQGCKLSNTEAPHADPEGCGSDAGFAEAVAAAQAADQVVLALGETREMSGEANARSTLDLPGRQEELIQAIKATGKPFAVVLFNGRPLALEDIVGDAPGDPRGVVPRRPGRPRRRRRRVRQGQPRRQAAGRRSRTGSARCRSTTTTSATGRPCNKDVKWNSRHRDIPSCEPLFEFGLRAQLHDVRRSPTCS